MLALFDGPRIGIVWRAFTRVEQDVFRARVQGVLDRASGEGASSRASATRLRQAAAAQERAAAQARRDAEERQRAEARALARQQAAYEADLAEARRQAARDASSSNPLLGGSSSSSSARSSGSSGSSGSGADSGYTGPRCYEPGGRTYHPC